MTPVDIARHLTAGTVASYLEDRLDAEVRSEVEVHLATCVDCRQEVVEVGRLLEKRRRTRLVVPAAGVAAAAIVALAVGLTIIGDRGQPDAGDAIRAPAGSGSPTVGISVVQPAPDQVLASDEAVRFIWNSSAPGSVFRVTLLDETGASLWSAESSDTVLALPSDVHLAPGARYFWFVDALGADGSAVTSGARRFSVR